MPEPKRCKDCVAEGVTSLRAPVPGAPGNRCATHHRAAKKRRQSLAHARRVEKGYGITAEQYQTLYEAQGGTCYICRKATGRTKKLAVDHDHENGLVRGLLCGPDNQMIGRLRELGLVNALNYLTNPPAFEVIGYVVVPDFVPMV